MTDEYRLKYILVGASGTGKSTMAKILEQELGLRRCITSTTRPPREGEVHGRDYFFCDVLNHSDMFEWAEFGGYEYGTTKSELVCGDFIILEPQGVEYYREHFPAPLTVIQLERTGIDVDSARRARDAGRGFDDVKADITVYGETVQEMTNNLLSALNWEKLSLAQRIQVAEDKRQATAGDFQLSSFCR